MYHGIRFFAIDKKSVAVDHARMSLYRIERAGCPTFYVEAATAVEAIDTWSLAEIAGARTHCGDPDICERIPDGVVLRHPNTESPRARFTDSVTKK